MKLSRLCSKQRHNLAESGVMVPLVSMLHSENYEVIEAALCALLSLSFGSERGFYHSSSTQSQLDAIATLHNLSTCQELIPLIVSFGVIFSSLELIHSSVKSSPLVEKAIGLLENIVSSSESALCEAASTGRAIRLLVETIEDGSLLGKEHAVGILLLICQSCREKYKGLILTEGVMPGLFQLSVDGTWRAKSMA